MGKDIEITEVDLEVIADLIKEGNTSGNFGSGNARISWDITINKWKD